MIASQNQKLKNGFDAVPKNIDKIKVEKND